MNDDTLPEIPKVLRLGGFDYKVVVDDNRTLLVDGRWGVTDANALTITLDSGAQRERQRETLLHEVLHGANYTLPPDDQADERQVRTLALGLFTAIRDNPGFWEFIGKE